MEELALEAARLVRLRIGNSYELLGVCPRPKHKWTVDVSLEAQPEACLPRGAELPNVIKEVTFELPSACRIVESEQHTATDGMPSPVLHVDKPPFQVPATSPLSCTVQIVITWQGWIGQPPFRL